MSIVEINPAFFSNDAQANFDSNTHADLGVNIKEIILCGSNLLIEGIRGTGKTHILKMIREEGINTFSKNRILPVYISLAKLSEFETIDETTFRIHLYTSIVENAISAIKQKIDVIEKADNPLLLKILKNDIPIFPFYKDKPIEEFLNEIEDVFQRLNKELLGGDIKIIGDTSKEINGEANVLENFKINGKYSKKEQIEYVMLKLAHNNASKYILDFFKELKNILELNYTLLLIDEISGVSNLAQIEVFRLLKLIRASNEGFDGTGFMYFIGSVYPPHNTNYPSKTKGHNFDFIIGEDCSKEFLEVDVLHEEYESFFRHITEKRLISFNPESKGSFLWLFDDEKTFLLSTFAANGLPRRFIEIIKTAYYIAKKKFSSSSEQKRIDYNSVNTAIQTLVDNEILDNNHLLDTDLYYLEKIIIPRLTRRNTQAETRNKTRKELNKNIKARKKEELPVHLYLNVSRMDTKKLGNLISRGAIHNLSRTRKSKTIEEGDTNIAGKMLMLDLAVAYYYRVFNIQNALQYFQFDLRENAKKGFKYYSEISLPEK